MFREVIETPGDGIITFQGMQDHTADSIKSLEGFKRAWVEEAQTLSTTSLALLRPTIRAPGSELWFSWNPRRKTDPVDKMLRGTELPTGAIVVRANWLDNPWLPAELEQERQDCLRTDPDQYRHIWEGDYASVLTGAYYAASLTTARHEKRIGNVSCDPLMPFKAFWDIGVKDATAIWIAQFVGREIRVLDYYEAVRQPLAAHLEWLRSNGYGNAECYLPHDGSQEDAVTGHPLRRPYPVCRLFSHDRAQPGQGCRHEARRGRPPAVSLDLVQCRDMFAGIDALGWYHEKHDEARNIGLGPEHDWSSHGADAFGLMCIAYEEPQKRPIIYPKRDMRWVV